MNQTIRASVQHSFDEYNNLSMTIQYGETKFVYTFSESYLKSKDYWKNMIKDMEKSDENLTLDNSDAQSWEPS